MSRRSLQALVKACQRGESEAWDEVLDRYGRLIWSVALRLGLQSEEAEEVFQRTWVAIVESIGKLRQPDRLVSWIASTARNQGLRLLDEKSRHRREAPLSETISDSSPSAEEKADAALVRQQETTALYQALDQLDERCQLLLKMLFFEEPSPDYQEIARRTGLAVGSIGPIRARCLKRLRKWFQVAYNQTLIKR
jgi:RNA polymerase sigma factor (sigma-70 family)